ncbi:hypothetical protein ONS95_012697 [Cadophora gregata]|uniref:uncharacterized protein n=1 Tax=Cadophora gregata TaxID=51156 RepID=UPI0026DC852A|nr:uncharacterized protein ONS95_012697 [Cadophora gregata]KAK0118408.1 hypothetical protein ONS95_012697 [Cadophora gregata]KAK0123478.1 hypothetical protein ONS96_010461 [Cadophora gregata f. sp. sojae]
MQISFQVIALALLASSQALSTVVITERDEGTLIERNPDPKGGLLKGALGLLAGVAAAAGAAKAGGAGAAAPATPATPATPSTAPGASAVASTRPQSSDAVARRRARRQRAAARQNKH